MIVELHEPARAREWCAGRTGLGFVPTMGALHEGHLELVRRAVRENDAACASVFVNPLQFGEAQDFERYPRDFARDARLLDSVGCAMVFTGTLAGFFPGELDARGSLPANRLVDPGPPAQGLEGEHRPGHFAGVATIVARLFDVVKPARAYFGAKDFQQTLVVKDLVRRIGGPEIIVCPTSREDSGLARSSRNERLNPAERAHASAIVRALRSARDAWRHGVREAAALRTQMRANLHRGGIVIEYAEVRDPDAWTAHEPAGRLHRAVALVAARVGPVRLIDNMRLDDVGEER
jgi:pantoate--beta-alanine ligase